MAARCPPRNMLFIMSDEHNKRILGAAGDTRLWCLSFR
jgi:hypothetical protein